MSRYFVVDLDESEYGPFSVAELAEAHDRGRWGRLAVVRDPGSGETLRLGEVIDESRPMPVAAMWQMGVPQNQPITPVVQRSPRVRPSPRRVAVRRAYFWGAVVAVMGTLTSLSEKVFMPSLRRPSAESLASTILTQAARDGVIPTLPATSRSATYNRSLSGVIWPIEKPVWLVVVGNTTCYTDGTCKALNPGPEAPYGRAPSRGVR